MTPMLVQYDAPGWGVGEIWLDDDGRVFHSELPRARRRTRARFDSDVVEGSLEELAARLRAFFAGKADDFADVELAHDGGFYGACVRALRAVPRGDVVTYGELALLAGRPRAVRAAGTFCARCELSPFVPTHRVVSVGGLGSYGDLGVDYKRRLLELEGVAL
jgi:methylated-DNA-[protein]-cysteine S-methyltransferase